MSRRKGKIKGKKNEVKHVKERRKKAAKKGKKEDKEQIDESHGPGQRRTKGEEGNWWLMKE